jgi:hypothetical protein
MEAKKSAIQAMVKNIANEEYVNLDTYDNKACLDGNFTSDQLRKIADALEEYNKL